MLYGFAHSRAYLVVTLCVLTISSLQSKSSFDTDALELGPHPVGFRSIMTYDYGRYYEPVPHTQNKSDGTNPRPIQISIWYPAAPTETLAHLTVGDYTFLSRIDRALDSWSEDELHRHLDSLVTISTRRGRSASDVRKMLGTKVGATKGSPPLAAGQHPLVVYGPSMIASVRGNVRLYEYLASHGYIVASHPSFGVAPRMMDTGPLGIETQVRDMQFTLAYMTRQFKQAIGPVALMGHSWGGMAAVLAGMRDASVDAIISLDSSVEVWRDLIVSVPDYDIIKMTKPILYVATSDNIRARKKHGFYDSLKFADKYLLSFPTLAHFDVVSRRYAPKNPTGQRAPTAKDTLYAINNRFVLGFLDGYLRENSTHLRDLVNWTKQNRSDVSVEFSGGRPAPPNTSELIKLFLDGNGEEAKQAVRSARAITPDAYKEKTLIRVGELILWSWHHFPEAEEALQFAAALYPNSARVYEMLGNVYWGMGDDDSKTASFRKSLELDPSNKRVQGYLESKNK